MKSSERYNALMRWVDRNPNLAYGLVGLTIGSIVGILTVVADITTVGGIVMAVFFTVITCAILDAEVENHNRK